LHPQLGLQVQQENSAEKPKNHGRLAPHLGLHDVPRNFMQRRRPLRRLGLFGRCRRKPAPPDEVRRIPPTPLRLLAPPPSLLALGRRAGVLPLAYAGIRLKPPSAQRARSLAGHGPPSRTRRPPAASSARIEVARETGAPPVWPEPPPPRQWLA
jgi:hypothetical protein